MEEINTTPNANADVNADAIVNKVANSGLINLDLEDFYPAGPRMGIDLADYLFQGLILREKDFRSALKEADWSSYQDAFVYIHCSADAIVPLWAYMLLSSQLAPFAKKVVFGSSEDLEAALYQEIIEDMDIQEFVDQRVIVKGCSNKPVPNQAFVALVQKIQPVVKSLMFGEACSTVPVFKKPREKK
jgi:hypothetical protein